MNQFILNNMQKLGQHFLINHLAIKRIIDALDLKSGDLVIEIGSGKGALTLPLAEACAKIGCQLMAIEKDPDLASSVERLAFSKKNKLEVIRGDALEEIPKITKRLTLTTKHFKVVGNIPYYITGRLLRVLGELNSKPVKAVLMAQKEVAERLIAKPPKMNLLAAAVQFWAEPKIIFTLKPKDFRPSPKVESAVIEMASSVQHYASRTAIKRYYELVKILFKQPRKTVLNNLRNGLKISTDAAATIMYKHRLTTSIRPQNLTVDQIKNLVSDIEL